MIIEANRTKRSRCIMWVTNGDRLKTITEGILKVNQEKQIMIV